MQGPTHTPYCAVTIEMLPLAHCSLATLPSAAGGMLSFCGGSAHARSTDAADQHATISSDDDRLMSTRYKLCTLSASRDRRW